MDTIPLGRVIYSQSSITSRKVQGVTPPRASICAKDRIRSGRTVIIQHFLSLSSLEHGDADPITFARDWRGNGPHQDPVHTSGWPADLVTEIDHVVKQLSHSMSSSQILSFCNLLYFYCNVKNCSWEGFSFVAFRQGSSHCSVLPRNIGVLADFSHYKCRKLLPFFLYFYIFSDEASSIFHVVHCQSLSVRQGSTAFCLCPIL